LASSFGPGTIMNKEEQLRSIGKHKRHREPFFKLGDVLNKLVDEGVSPRYRRFSSARKIWNEILPYELTKHCKLDGINGGWLRVVVDKPAYRYELEMCRHEVLKKLNQECPGAKLKGLRVTIV